MDTKLKKALLQLLLFTVITTVLPGQALLAQQLAFPGAEGHGAYDQFGRLTTWMDTYAQRQGSFSRQQEKELKNLRRQLAGMLTDSGK